MSLLLDTSSVNVAQSASQLSGLLQISVLGPTTLASLNATRTGTASVVLTLGSDMQTVLASSTQLGTMPGVFRSNGTLSTSSVNAALPTTLGSFMVALFVFSSLVLV